MGAAKSTLLIINARPHHGKSKMAQQLPQGGLTGTAKLKAVTDLVSLLTHDLTKSNLKSQQRDTALEELKVYGRDPRNADPIFTKEGIETLTRHAFDSSSSTTSRNALRCLANSLLLKPETRQMFLDLGFEQKACNKLKSNNLDDEFLVSRIIFLMTYGTNIKLETLIDQYHLADYITQNLSRHAKLASAKPSSSGNGSGSSGSSTSSTGSGISITKSKPKPVDPMADMALTETAKLLFNVTHFCGDRVDVFTQAIAPIVTLICKHDIPQGKPLDPPLGPLVNALLTLNLSSDKGTAALFPKSEPAALTERLVQLLDLALRKYSDSDMDSSVLPLVTALRKIYELAPVDTVRPVMHAKLLPTEADRKKALGQTESLASLILRHTTNALAPELRNSVSHMLFELSDKDATKFVHNVGYGFASGFLFQNNVPVPEGATETFRAASADNSGRDINAVTGQFVDEEKEPDLPEMTDEEKEREAERLFVLFERLRRTGVVNVENPVAQALRSGRFDNDKIDGKDRIEELDD
ncbi:guanine nucleotide exchange factor synembryn [Ophiostoma piceae UAMH 11346]|uniref:Guanine nucleotide exchange factor synembryn n=1 Tax=Ophiostoma piceae (strain UAMH 11346) TaxID=1262450 RepID=S3BYA3_OPHP1|nr:guanine nucleotide exchange factor synembryn [Ophiostoma piceae UAMH 11346]